MGGSARPGRREDGHNGSDRAAWAGPAGEQRARADFPAERDAARAASGGEGRLASTSAASRPGERETGRLRPHPPSVTSDSVFLSLCQLFCKMVIIFFLEDCWGASMSSRKHFINIKLHGGCYESFESQEEGITLRCCIILENTREREREKKRSEVPAPGPRPHVRIIRGILKKIKPVSWQQSPDATSGMSPPWDRVGPAFFRV